MPAPVFPDRSQQPSLADLNGALVDSATLLDGIQNHLKLNFGPPSLNWKFYSKSAGWTVAIKVKKRTVVHLLPGLGFSTLVIVLGKTAATAAADANLPTTILADISSAREYVEGRSIRFDVATRDDLETVFKLVDVKLSN